MEDTLNSQIGVLTRREVEARIVAPLLEALAAEFDRQRVLEIARQVIEQVARQQGAELAQRMGGCSLAHFAQALEAWKKGDAMDMDVLEQSETRFSFNVTCCGYAQMYQALGVPELGQTLSCSRDFALVEGFSPAIQLERTQTILEGAPFCDFRYRISGAPPG